MTQDKLRKESVEKFFKYNDTFRIPSYQRAYSWDKDKQVSQFLKDLQESAAEGYHYFFGSILLEETQKDYIDIIDGQQRITTIIIFARAMYNVLESRLDSNENLQKIIDEIKDDFIESRDKAKLIPVQYDDTFFYELIIKNIPTSKPSSPSQNRIKESKEYFEKELEKLETNEILNILKCMRDAEIFKVSFDNRQDSILMFALQNSRGKDLTNLEILKSYLCYRIYMCDDKQLAENKIKRITTTFEEIYQQLNYITKNEDEIFRYFNQYYTNKGFSYENNYYQILLESQKGNAAKIEWIEKYVSALKNAFVNFRNFLGLKTPFASFIQKLDIAESYPFILKSYTLFDNNEEKIEQVCKCLEVVCFREKLIKTRADLSTRLNSALLQFDSIDSLKTKLAQMYSGWKYYNYWGDDVLARVISSTHLYEEFNNKAILRYIFMRYENFLRSGNIDTKGILFDDISMANKHIDHITPQNAKETMIEKYCEYDDDFYANYLNSIGNLVLMSDSQNCSKSNNPPEATIQNGKLLMQLIELKEFAKENGTLWDKDSIKKRGDKIRDFILQTWKL